MAMKKKIDSTLPHTPEYAGDLPHTPGEWFAVQRTVTRHRRKVKVWRVESTIKTVVADQIYTSQFEPSETYGNACLLAGAKQAYTACKTLVEWVHVRIEDDPRWIDRQAGFLKQAWLEACRAVEQMEGQGRNDDTPEVDP